MGAVAIHAGRFLTPHEELLDSVLLSEDGKITAIGHRDEVPLPPGTREVAAGNFIVVPGFVDVHIHGAGGHDVMEGTEKALDHVVRMAAQHGTTSLLATTATAPADETCRSLEGIARYIESPQNRSPQPSLPAEVLGIHLEGPFLSVAQRGVHPKADLAKPSPSLFDRFFEASRGHARILTLAPEIPGALDLMDHAAKKGLVLSIGHTDATYEQARQAIAHGARHATHVFNAMRPFHHREPGVLGAVMMEPEMTADVIADFIHVAPAAIQVLLAAKGAERIVLISDGLAATGMPDGTYKLADFEVVLKDGVCRNAEGKLAGSTLTLDRAIRHMVSLGVPLIQAVRMATLHPARRLGIAGKKGVLAPGADADLVILTQELKVAGVMCRGQGLE